MSDSLNKQLFSLVASAHVAARGLIRVSRLKNNWGVLHMGDDLVFTHATDSDREPNCTVYGTPEDAVHGFMQHFALVGIKEDPNVNTPLDDVEFLFEDVHANVAVTWRHLKARFKGIKMILKRTDRRIMEDIIEEAASM